MVELITPPEPSELKNEAKMRRESTDWNIDSLVAWYGNRLPKYLWSHWKEPLRKEGYTWQSFLKVLSLNKKDIIGWLRDQEEWEELIDQIRRTLTTPWIKKLVVGR
ncbi:hypothetical protein [Archaeoglobus fulgidus]|uniref:hypothetical protein n=1 Tax=Archaeoglobus fulgidus TaxID=2234 RepID=UPI00064E8F37|nr:hypothetical protein [Archaeoglobus fulgidus]